MKGLGWVEIARFDAFYPVNKLKHPSYIPFAMLSSHHFHIYWNAKMSFLKAEWKKLAIINYEVDSDILLPYLPAKTELDMWQGKCFLSLVGFMFLNTKLLGLSIPFHRHFEEVNLRFYVKHHDGTQWKRGVVFIKEIVPKPMLTVVANTVYKEHYAYTVSVILPHNCPLCTWALAFVIRLFLGHAGRWVLKCK